MIPILEFEDTVSFATYLGRNEIPQESNLNANARLFRLESRPCVAKIYDTDNSIPTVSDPRKNIDNLLAICQLTSAAAQPHIAFPTALISLCGQIVGYEMPYVSGVALGNALTDPQYSHYQIIDWFNQLTDAILSLPNGVYIGDLHPQNVLIREDNTIVLIDIDGFSVDTGHQMTCPATFLEHLPAKYYDDRGQLRISRDTDILCLFLIFFLYLFDGQDVFSFPEAWREQLSVYFEKRTSDSSLASSVAALFSNCPNFLQRGIFTCWKDISPQNEYDRFLALTGLDKLEDQAAEYLNHLIDSIFPKNEKQEEST